MVASPLRHATPKASRQDGEEERAECVPEWIGQGLGPQDEKWNTLLHRAIQSNEADVAAVLIAGGAEVTIRRKNQLKICRCTKSTGETRPGRRSEL